MGHEGLAEPAHHVGSSIKAGSRGPSRANEGRPRGISDQGMHSGEQVGWCANFAGFIVVGAVLLMSGAIIMPAVETRMRPATKGRTSRHDAAVQAGSRHRAAYRRGEKLARPVKSVLLGRPLRREWPAAQCDGPVALFRWNKILHPEIIPESKDSRLGRTPNPLDSHCSDMRPVRDLGTRS